mgnify:CR=1 FL=1
MKLQRKLAVTVIATAALVLSSSPAFAGQINGSGATFAQPLIDVCKVEFTKDTGHTVNYTAGGSGKGRTDFTKNLVDFAASDAVYTADFPANLEYAPVYAAPIAIFYNLPTVKESIYLSEATLAQIFSGYITNWDDKLIAADNERTVKTVTYKTKKVTVKVKGKNTTKEIIKEVPVTTIVSDVKKETELKTQIDDLKKNNEELQLELDKLNNALGKLNKGTYMKNSNLSNLYDE